MGGYNGLEVLVAVALLLTTGQCDVSCGINGQAGVAGTPGRDGWPGMKGEKGEPAVMDDGPVDLNTLLRMRGEMGSRGLQGVLGPKGFSGEVGASGRPGKPGQPGPSGRNLGEGQQQSPQLARSAFSVMRTLTTYPGLDTTVTYNTIVVNKPQDFNPGTGQFTCRVAGVYYFTFHSTAKVSMCLRIASDALTNKVAFCDQNKGHDQVLSGGVVLELAVGQRVWLESFREQQTSNELRDTREKIITFSGFLLFANPE